MTWKFWKWKMPCFHLRKTLLRVNFGDSWTIAEYECNKCGEIIVVQSSGYM